MQLTGKAAVVTGGGTGIGRATVLALAQAKCHVLVNYSRSQTEAEQTVRDALAHGVQAIPFQADVSDDAAVRRMMQAAASEFGRLDILVNNAGTTRFIAFDQLDAVDDEAWRHIFAVNVQGPFQCARAAQAHMLASGGGVIVNVSSTAAFLAVGSSIPYCASKAALNNVTISLARTFAPHIRVVGVAPGFVASRWLENGLGAAAYERTKAAFTERLPLQQVCPPEEIAAAILGLITGSQLVTGQTLPVDSGMMISTWPTPVKSARE